MNDISYVSLRPILENLADEKYRRFHARLVPGIHDFLGIRLPLLRKLVIFPKNLPVPQIG